MIHKVDKNPNLRLEEEGIQYYDSVQGAIDAARRGDVIEIGEGRFEEKIEVRTSGITLRGVSKESSWLTYSDYALKQMDDGNNYGTFRSYSLLIMADQVKLENLTVANEAGDGREVGQAVALYAHGDELIFSNCDFMAHQDTIFLGPLPDSPKIPGSFAGPSQSRSYERCMSYFEKCRITGDVDYIFGSGLTVFYQCELVTRNRDMDVNGYVTAPSTWEEEPYGFVFIHCDFKGQEGIRPGTVFYGRPWRPYGQVTLIDCIYDASIHADHFDPWGKEAHKLTTRFSEYHCLLRDKEKLIYEGRQAEEAPFIQIYEESRALDFLLPWHRNQLLKART